MIMTQEMAMEFLKNVIDPEVGLNIVDMGLVYGVEFPEEGVIEVFMTLTTPGCPMEPYMREEIQRVFGPFAGVREVRTKIVWEPQWTPSRIKPGALDALRNGEY